MKESKPKYLEIADAIHQEIRQEIYKQGDKLPVERELQERFGASRMTIRHALQKLDQQGVVRIDRGRGAFVMDLMIQRSKEILGVTELMERKGLKCHSKVLHLERIKPDEHIREAMNLKETDEVYFLHRIRYANDEAIAVEYAHINALYCPGLEMFNFESFSLYDVFYEHYHLDLSWARDDIRADSIRGEDAHILLQAKSGPALIVYNTAYDLNNNPIEYTKTIYNYKMFTYTVVSTETSKKYKNK